MRILSMTATFGKLENRTLTLEPGLNVIHAPNEWGKSTWCAFLVAMLYGMETRTHSTKAALADKERYAPWSGAPMSGRMEILWEGRAVTIERQSRGRIPMGVFRAYETGTGLEVPELTAGNCGQTLLGVERSVFLRSGFLRLTDLPVTQDEALRRRLNALVTTGDESGAGDALAQTLKDLKNRCCRGRSGLLPQAEEEKAAAEEALRRLDALEAQEGQLRQRQAALAREEAELENHRLALDFAAAQADALRVSQAEQAWEAAKLRARQAEQACRGLPGEEEARASLAAIAQAQSALGSLGPAPQPPVPPPPFRGHTPREAKAMAEADSRSLGTNTPALLLAMLAGALLCGSFFLQNQLLWLGISLLLLTAAALLSLRRRKKRKALEAKYGSGNPQLWRSLARDYEAAQGTYEEALARWTRRRAALEAAVSREIPQSGDPQAAVSAWEALARARSDCRQAEAHAKALAAMAKPAPPPRFPDYRAESPAETHNRLAAIREERSALSRRLGQCQGQMEALGDKASLLSRLSALEERIRKLEQTYAALTLAQETLDKAKAELQRRFAPEITRQTQAFFSRLTGGRYHRLTLGRDLALTVAAPEETILRAPLWRSDGTADQLYLALRLAVSKALIPQAPFVLDDALARFDDTRLAAAMTILKQEADSRQILLFTCQSREAQYL